MIEQTNLAVSQGNPDFFDALPTTSRFSDLTGPDSYVALPDDWIVVLTDIATSRREIERGKYKAVNMVGAAMIAAVKNLAPGVGFPFVFGGDGATVAFPGRYTDDLRAMAAGMQDWARDAFELGLRAGVVSVADIRAAGHDVRVAKYAASDAVSYAAFSGGGISWLEKELKAGRIGIGAAPVAVPPNVEGLSCRWSNVKAVNGNIVSVVVEPAEGVSAEAFGPIARDVLDMITAQTGGSGPVPEVGPDVQFPPPGMEIEARASRAGKSFARRYMELAAQNLVAWFFFRTGLKAGQFDPVKYARQTALNSDHQKFEDGLKMTIDCDDATVALIRARLSDLKDQGKVRFGLQVQSEAMVTCIVPSPLDEDHIHFVDGAGGGYAAAASML